MALLSIDSFVNGVFESELLDPAQREELRRLQKTAADTRDLAQDLIRRDWLTAFQVNQILHGNAASLILGPYILLQRVGEGGMGQVFKAKQRVLQRTVALKVIRKECLSNPKVVLRFQREIRAAGQLNHPHIVRAFDADQLNGTWFIAMEFIDGIDLAQMVKEKGPLPIAQACEYIRQAALGLQHAFERGLVHRDIKPANLLVTKAISSDRRRSSGMIARPSSFDIKLKQSSGALPRIDGFYPWGVVKILDMGLARCTGSLSERSGTNLTQVGSVMGTPEFIAPEQARDAHNSDTRADLYSLGCTLYYLLTGQPPFTKGTFTEKLMQHQFDEPEPLAKTRLNRLEKLRQRQEAGASLAGPTKHIKVDDIDPRVPAAIARVVRKLMAKKPESRYQTPIELANELQEILKQLADGTLPLDDAQDMSTEELPILDQLAEVGPTLEIDASQKKPRWRVPVLPLILASCGGCAMLVIATLLAIVLSRGRATQAGAAPPEPAAKTKEIEEPTWKRYLRQGMKNGSWDNARLELLKARAADPQKFDELLTQLPTPLDALDRTAFDGILPPGHPPEVIGMYGFHKGPAKLVHSVVLSANGRWLITNEDENVRLFDLQGSMIPHKILAHEKRVTRVVVSPDGRLLASASEDGVVRVWDVQTRNRVAVFDKHQKAVTQLVFSPDGKQLASAGRDGFVRLWDPRTGVERHAVESGLADVLALTFEPSGGHLFWSGQGSDVRWVSVDKLVAGHFQTGLSGSRVIAFQPHGKRVILGGLQGQLLVAAWEHGVMTRTTLLKEQQQVHQVAFAPDGKSFVSAGSDSSVVLWDGQSLKAAKTFKSIRVACPSVVFSPEGRHLLVGGANNQVFILRLGTPDRNLIARSLE